jgi:hypothetical protein
MRTTTTGPATYRRLLGIFAQFATDAVALARPAARASKPWTDLRTTLVGAPCLVLSVYDGTGHPHRTPARIRELLTDVTASVAAMEASGWYSTGDVNVLSRSRFEILKHLWDLDVGLHVHAPPVIANVLLVFLAVYYVFIPATLWRPYRFYTLVVYPAVMLILVGPWIISRWIGNPFHIDGQNRRRLIGMPFNTWCAETEDVITAAFDGEKTAIPSLR